MLVTDLHRKAMQLVNQRAYPQALDCCQQIIAIDENHADAHFLMGIIASERRLLKHAIESIQHAIKLDPSQCDYYAHLAKCFALLHRHEEAILACTSAANLSPSDSLTLDTLGTVLSKVGLHGEAVPYFEKAVKINSRQPNYLYNLAAAYRINGQFSAARDILEQLIALEPGYFKAYSILANLSDITEHCNHIDKIKHQLHRYDKQRSANHSNSHHSQATLHLYHALAIEYESLGQFDLAFESLYQGKQQKLAFLDYRFTDDLALFNAIQAQFPTTLESTQNDYHHSPRETTQQPIFVVGMPRTGTTLTERILTQHSEVASAGELQTFPVLFKQFSGIQSAKVLNDATIQNADQINYHRLGETYLKSTQHLTGTLPNFVDKMPLNVLYAGFILRALPQAKIICLHRHPLDTVISNYKQLFAVNFSYYNYALALNTTADYFIEFYKLSKHWQQLFPNNFYTLSYEKLVNNPEEEIAQILKFCSLDWQESCRHVERNVKPIATASAVQVRSPIHNRSVGHWKNYEGYLAEVKAKFSAASIPF